VAPGSTAGPATRPRRRLTAAGFHAIIHEMDDAEIQRVLAFWFQDGERDSPHIDSRMDRWFGSHPELDREVVEQFGALTERAVNGDLDAWAASARGRLALIIVLDQFCRHIHRGTAAAFAGDRRALRLCVEGIVDGLYKQLRPEEQLFFFMPLQHAESLKVQERSVRIFRALAGRVTETLRETFATTAQFAELHRDIVAEFGRFPHRNAALGRENTPAEAEYLSADAPSFGQQG